MKKEVFSLVCLISLVGYVSASSTDEDIKSDEGNTKTATAETTNNGVILSEQADDAGLPYEIKFKGTLTQRLLDLMQDVSILSKLQDRPPNSFSALGARADQDRKQFKKVLKSLGYMLGDVEFRISMKDDKAIVKFKIRMGPRYRYGDLSINSSDNKNVLFDANINLTYDIIQLRVGEKVDFENIRDGVKKIKRYLLENGYPFVKVSEPFANVDHEQKKLWVTYPVITGPKSIVMETVVSGNQDVQSEFIQNRVAWQEGALFNIKDIERTKANLAQTQLISNIDVVPERLDQTSIVDAKGMPIEKPVRLKLKIYEGPPRVIGAGLRFATSEGINGRFFWHHNNIFGGQEHFGISYSHGLKKKRFKVEYDTPDFFAPNQILMNTYRRVLDDTRAYKGTIHTFTSAVKRPIYDRVSLSVGALYEVAHLKHENQRRSHKIWGIPMELLLNFTDSKLDPGEGFRVNTSFTPFFGKIQDTNNMQILNTKGSLYVPFKWNALREVSFMIAMYGRLGTILINRSENVPFNRRFYGGGAGSVRAYGYQMMGPLDNNNEPRGGRAIVEYGAEARFRFTDTIGGVVFVEAGTVGPKKVPSLKRDNIFWGPGLGMRYFTSFAPIRLDVAFPMRRRKSGKKMIDAPFQFYVSIGQAF